MMDQARYAAIKAYTKTPQVRFDAMRAALRHVEMNEIPGDIAECGVWRGGNIILARTCLPRRVCWLYDTFTGMTKPTVHDFKRGGGRMSDKPFKDAISLDDVRNNFQINDVLDEEMLRFVVGPVEQTLQDEDNLPEQLALLRLDTDWYESTRVEMEVLWPRLVSGGVLIVDDYGHWMGCQKAVNEYFNGSPPEMSHVDYSCVVVYKS